MVTRFPVLRLGLGAAAAVLAAATPAAANEFAPQMKAAFEEMVSPWLSDPVLVEAIRAQNAAHADLSEAQVDALDATWREEAAAGGGPLVVKVTTGAAAELLKEKARASRGVLTEVFVMDNRGLNVASNVVTSDYMQGDEAKWQETFPAGAGGVHVGEIEFDASTETFQAQYSATVVDPDNGEAIGAITVGMKVEELL